jgi:hypothetical protein
MNADHVNASLAAVALYSAVVPVRVCDRSAKFEHGRVLRIGSRSHLLMSEGASVSVQVGGMGFIGYFALVHFIRLFRI